MSTSIVGMGEPCATAAKPPMTTNCNSCRVSVSSSAPPLKSATLRLHCVLQLPGEGDAGFHPLDALSGCTPKRSLCLRDVGVVVRRQLDNKLEAAQPQQPLHLLERGGGAAGFEPRDSGLRCLGSAGEFGLGDAGAPACLPHKLPP